MSVCIQCLQKPNRKYPSEVLAGVAVCKSQVAAEGLRQGYIWACTKQTQDTTFPFLEKVKHTAK